MIRTFLLHILLLTLLVFACQDNLYCQKNVVITTGKYIDGELLPHVRLSEVRCAARRRFKTKRAQERYTRLVKNVKKVLPYARIAAARLNEIEDSLSHISNEKLRKKYIADAEKALFAEFEKPIKHLSIRQGRLLIKLIDRETGNTSYELIRTLKGRFSAFMWQGVARIFGSSLKAEYDAEGEDKYIEYIVNAIDAGLYDDY